MTHRFLRRGVLLTLLAPFSPSAIGAAGDSTQESQHKMPNAGNVHWTGNEQIAMLIYPGVTAPDLIGPHSMFGALMGAKVLLVAKSPIR